MSHSEVEISGDLPKIIGNEENLYEGNLIYYRCLKAHPSLRRPLSAPILARSEPCQLGGTDRFANPQEHLLAALNACMTVGYVAQCAVRGITRKGVFQHNPPIPVVPATSI